MTTVTLEGTQELMKQREVAVILATGGMGLVRAAYSAGKPAYGVGPGNAPVLHRAHPPIWPRPPATSSLGKTLRQRRALLVAEFGGRRRADRRRGAARSSRRQGGHFLSPTEADALAKALVTPQRLPNPALVGKSAPIIAEKVGITRPARHARR